MAPLRILASLLALGLLACAGGGGGAPKEEKKEVILRTKEHDRSVGAEAIRRLNVGDEILPIVSIVVGAPDGNGCFHDVSSLCARRPACQKACVQEQILWGSETRAMGPSPRLAESRIRNSERFVP